ncbi:MAG: ZIP family metal transporter [Lutibacter sp.]|uniref:ZIP family metal transporter n=1 Tax=Lutibacter sp. TaxID=1925666 RepID=UPI00299E11C7|nr:ZIP family metal transporter [Lutibacter sp.]MDX1828159.1 ZIP family metal transporter [Lutibacter sp.]
MTYLVLIASVLIGIIIVYGFKPGTKTVQLLLSFSGAYLLAISILHLLPEVYKVYNKTIGIYILIGLILQLVLDFFSKGAEHGHIHEQNTSIFPWALFISLSIHAFMEGIPLANNLHHEHLLWAIVVHKIPVAIILGTFFVKSTIPKKYAVVFLLVFALMSPLGSFIGENSQFLIRYKSEIMAIIIGVFLHISTIILFESSKDHKFNLLKFTAILVGMSVAFLA